MEDMHARRRRRSIGAVASATVALAAGALAVVAASPAHAVTCDSVRYEVVGDWGTAHQAKLTLIGPDGGLNGWTVEFDLPDGADVQSAWNLDWSQSGRHFTGSDVGWNGTVAAGEEREVAGLVVGGPAFAIGEFLLNGERCGEPAEPDTTTPLTETPSDEPSETPSEDPSETAPPDGSCPAGAVCDGFEDQTGATPGGDWTVGAENCTGTGTATVDDTFAHGGSTSIRIDGGGNYCNHIFIGRELPADAEWFRLYVDHTTAQPQNHTTMVAMGDANDGDRDLRLGGQNGALQWNRESDDATLPAQSPAGVALSRPLPVDSWTCVEFHVAGGELRTWIDGDLVEGLVVDGVPDHDIDEQWLSRSDWHPSLTDLRLGWESYGSETDTLWYDDVAFGTERIGC
ncbi:cellulose binding domain-containing protein [Glycomyces tarimensis]